MVSLRRTTPILLASAALTALLAASAVGRNRPDRPSMLEDVEGRLLQPDRDVVQRAADLFSWQEFNALNAHSGLREWETWKDANDVFLPDGTEPSGWGMPTKKAYKLLQKLADSDPKLHFLTDSLQATQSDGTLPATLTDRNGHIVRYEVRMNRVMFDYIRTNQLYDSGLQSGKSSIDFPDGSVLVKAAWRELERGEEKRFITADAVVYDTNNNAPQQLRKRKVGLVGLHIVSKTPSAPQWIWSTFEQVDNVSGDHASFFEVGCTEPAANQQTHRGVSNQVTRETPISGTSLVALNQRMQAAAGDAPLKYYQLVNTQWPLPRSNDKPAEANTVLHTVPDYVANTTMETFTQETSSCIGCHSSARTSRQDRTVSADFTFVLNRAKPEVVNPAVLPPAIKPVTDWDRKNWKSIQRGIELTNKTYELLPKHVTAKLHCGSCHLDSGRNPASGWWTGMLTKYEHPASPKLYARINQCFERSMNGVPIATDSKEMRAFINYMRWLDEQYAATHSSPPKVGLPPVDKGVGDSERGKEIFVQKCAVCHGKEGEGRYGSGVYYRPALWGDHSFNNLAGLSRHDRLVPFLKVNMPLGSGGILTVQEAWDLATFIDSRQRPIRPAPPNQPKLP